MGTIYECGKCSAEFGSMEELNSHVEEKHKTEVKKIVDNTECQHLTTIPCFDGLDHMNTEEAEGWFVDECVLCKHKSKPYKLQYKIDKENKENNGGLGQWLKQT